jgi:hypothetical protein
MNALAAHARLPLELEHIDTGTETFLYANALQQE